MNYPSCALLVSLVFGCTSGLTYAQDSSHSQSAQLITEDVDRFYRAIDAAMESESPIEVIQAEYIDRASPGLDYYVKTRRIESAQRLWEIARKYPNQYRAVASFYEQLKHDVANFARVYEFFDDLHDVDTTPPVYFIIGHFHGGATASPDGLIIALDNWAADWGDFDPEQTGFDISDPTDVLTQIIAHELVHYHQQCASNCETLLAETLQEGGADFLAYLMTGERANRYMKHIYSYYDNNASVVWPLFQRDMLKEERGTWLYNNDVHDRPENLGYAIGFAIVDSYYDKSNDKGRAIREILELNDPLEFLELSGYMTTD